MTINRKSLFQAFKYTVYALLAMNVYWFFAAEYESTRLLYPNGVAPGDLIAAFTAAIDTGAWVILLLMFELETYVLEDRHFTRPVALGLHGLRAICYAFIIYAFSGYVSNLLAVQAVTPMPGVVDLCSLASSGWSYSVGLEDFTEITAANCNAFSSADSFVRFENARAVVDAAGLSSIIGLAWVDVINSAVWLLVVAVLEIDVRLQEHNRYEGLAYRASFITKLILYSVLFFAAVYWWVYGDFVDFWDAFLWLVAFIFIELNVFEWRQEELEEAALASGQDLE